MGEIFEGIGQMLERPDIYVSMEEPSSISTTSIGTDALGTCVGFLFHLNHYSDDSVISIVTSFMVHYYSEVDEAGLTVVETLKEVLRYLGERLKTHLGFTAFYSDDKPHVKISFTHLLIVGGDPTEAAKVQNGFALLNKNTFDDLVDDKDDDEIRFLIFDLMNKVIIFKSISKMLSDREEKHSKSKQIKFLLQVFPVVDRAIEKKEQIRKQSSTTIGKNATFFSIYPTKKHSILKIQQH